ncbi:hypothetical protein AC1031_010962 [Aphanomyces cochlioides]|nr:hypothetical protein AC1031_010962 [Aphanomyces cochlioides]
MAAQERISRKRQHFDRRSQFSHRCSTGCCVRFSLLNSPRASSLREMEGVNSHRSSAMPIMPSRLQPQRAADVDGQATPRFLNAILFYYYYAVQNIVLEILTNQDVLKLAQVLVPVLHGNIDDQPPDAHVTQIKQVIEDLLASPSLLIKPTQRIDEFENADEFINMDYHIKAATSFFSTLHEFRKRKCAIVFGQKQQGKSQFLYFLAKLLIALGEGVVYLDQTIAPPIGKRLAVIDKDCCLNLWQPSLETFLKANGGQAVLVALELFRKVGDYGVEFGDPEQFKMFYTILRVFCKQKN